jgi:hypothetical protein
MENLKELLSEELKDLYSAEKQIVKALPKVISGGGLARPEGVDPGASGGDEEPSDPP